jgi:hypothetical protein
MGASASTFRVLAACASGHGFCSSFVLEESKSEREGANMIEFAVGIMVGGSIGAVIMGALLAQTRTTVGVHSGASLQVRAPMQAAHHSATRSAHRDTESRPMRVRPRPTLVAASALLH